MNGKHCSRRQIRVISFLVQLCRQDLGCGLLKLSGQDEHRNRLGREAKLAAGKVWSGKMAPRLDDP